MKKILLLILIFLVTTGFTSHPLTVSNDGDSYFISSVPEEILNEKQLMLTYYRDGSNWVESYSSMPERAGKCTFEKVEKSKENIEIIKLILDEIYPDKPIAFSYTLCNHDIVIYLDPDLSDNKEAHKELMKMINLRRTK